MYKSTSTKAWRNKEVSKEELIKVDSNNRTRSDLTKLELGKEHTLRKEN